MNIGHLGYEAQVVRRGRCFILVTINHPSDTKYNNRTCFDDDKYKKCAHGMRHLDSSILRPFANVWWRLDPLPVIPVCEKLSWGIDHSGEARAGWWNDCHRVDLNGCWVHSTLLPSDYWPQKRCMDSGCFFTGYATVGLKVLPRSIGSSVSSHSIL